MPRFLKIGGISLSPKLPGQEYVGCCPAAAGGSAIRFKKFGILASPSSYKVTIRGKPPKDS